MFVNSTARVVLEHEGLTVAESLEDQRVTFCIRLKTDRDCLLHWGISEPGRGWQCPPGESWPSGTTAMNTQAASTPLVSDGNGTRQVAIQLERGSRPRNLAFVLHLAAENRWLRGKGGDFIVAIPRDGRLPTPEAALQKWNADDAAQVRVFELSDGSKLAVQVRQTESTVRVRLVSDAEGPLLLHWGLAARFRHEWELPPEEVRPPATTVFDQRAVQTPFGERDGLQYLELELRGADEKSRPRGLRFVLHQPTAGRWLNYQGGDLYLPLFAAPADARLTSVAAELAEQIVGAEMGAPSWTLMHRFNLCHDLVDRAQNDEDALALLYAWLRYSATRQLDWQRSYNTKPRELSHAQDRLTLRLAGLWRRQPASEDGARRRFWLRLMLTTLGRGGDGQRVRDEILHIMHRHHIKEASGHFIEEWHQKLHNNTTPDDIAICQAYLAFLKSNGDLAKFNETLEAAHVTRERLRSLDRPITHDPTFYPDKKDALIPEFENFLRILKSVHAGTDLESAAGAARGWLEPALNDKLGKLLALHRSDAGMQQILPLLQEVRDKVARSRDRAGDDGALRDLLFLDLALEDVWRGTVERADLGRLQQPALVELVTSALRHLTLSVHDDELELCAGHWTKLAATKAAGREQALHFKSVADRAARWLQSFTDAVYRRLQPKADYLGSAFKAADWVVSLFSEEVVRGGPTFALSLVLRRLDPLLRQAAGMGGWQVISPGHAAGRVRVANKLRDVQTEQFAAATVLIADTVQGDEEIPAGVTAVLTSDTPDLVSHVAVRARNAHLLFATCFDRDAYEKLKSLRDRTVELRVSAGGDVTCTEAAVATEQAPAPAGKALRVPTPRRAEAWVLSQDQFTRELVGGKSNNLSGLRGRLPEWIHLPASLALPFGSFEKVLEADSNRDVRRRYEALVADAERDPLPALAALRALVQELQPPSELKAVLLDAWPRAGFAPMSWEQCWRAIQRVWASKWNDRAFLSRRHYDMPHDRLQMAVLIQTVVPADYAFVLHTANPFTGNADEIYGEVVLGLGETLVGNYPGRALGFICPKGDLQPTVLSFPGKSEGLYGRGVIFRSDSNGEDLEGFAGAGLYDSFLAEEPERRRLDYRSEKLLWDPGFRAELLRTLGRIGLEVERLLGAAQDIEGAVAGGQYYVVQTRPQVGLDAS